MIYEILNITLKCYFLLTLYWPVVIGHEIFNVKNAEGISSIILDFVSNNGIEYILGSSISISYVLFFGPNDIVKSKNIT